VCGLYAEYNQDGVVNDPSCLNPILHRGPDQKSCEQLNDNYLIAHARLSIIDVENGQQPIYSQDKSVSLICNGEIYNYQVLRNLLISEGSIFNSKSDSEVILHGYIKWGIEGLLRKIDGMFAFVLIDLRKNTTFVAIDRFGEKPCFFSSTEKDFKISSSLNSFSDFKIVNRVALASYLTFGFNLFRESIRKNVFRVEAGTYVKFQIMSSVNIEIRKYWDAETALTLKKDTPDIEVLLRESVQSRMVSDVPIGVALSGGIDSSIITSIAHSIDSNVSAYSLSFPDSPDFDETLLSKKVAKQIGIKHTIIEFSKSDFESYLQKSLAELDEPCADPALIAFSALSERASQDIKVLLSGEGADEIFGGYKYYEQETSTKTNFPRIELSNYGFPFASESSLLSGFFGMDSFSKIAEQLDISQLEIRSHIEDSQNLRLNSPVRDKITLQQVTDIKTWLTSNLLVKLDRSTMRYGIEGRVPFLYEPLVISALNLDEKEKILDSEFKKYLRDFCSEILSERIHLHPKKGLIPPYAEFLSSNMPSILKNELLFLREYNLNFQTLSNSRDIFNRYFVSNWIMKHGMVL